MLCSVIEEGWLSGYPPEEREAAHVMIAQRMWMTSCGGRDGLLPHSSVCVCVERADEWRHSPAHIRIRVVHVARGSRPRATSLHLFLLLTPACSGPMTSKAHMKAYMMRGALLRRYKYIILSIS